jgi:hypothetical protein
MPNPWLSLRHDQPLPFNKAVNEKEQLEKGMKEEGENKDMSSMNRYINKFQ